MNENEREIEDPARDNAAVPNEPVDWHVRYKPYTYADLARDIANLTPEQQAQVVCFCEPYDEADLSPGQRAPRRRVGHRDQPAGRNHDRKGHGLLGVVAVQESV